MNHGNTNPSLLIYSYSNQLYVNGDIVMHSLQVQCCCLLGCFFERLQLNSSWITAHHSEDAAFNPCFL